jgi:radical SAM superfamily enzyme YgiQ (UPF0313 family)
MGKRSVCPARMTLGESREIFVRALLLYPRLEPSYWSLPIATRLGGAKAQAPPLGLLTVAALLPRDWDLRLVDMNVSSLKEDDWDWAELVLLSGMLPQREGLLQLVKQGKRRGKWIAAGGAYPSTLPQEVLDTGADWVVEGEGEAAVHLLIQALGEGRRGMVVASGEKPPMTLSPIPRFDLVRFRDYAYMTVQTSRGCPFDCEFCDVVKLFGRKPRYKTPEQVIGEMDALYRQGHRGLVFIADDNFIGVRSRALDILSALTKWQTERGEPFGFTTQAALDLGNDPEMIDALTASNFGQVFIGIESADASALALSHKYQNLKNAVLGAVRNINANGLTVIGSFVVGLDGEAKGVDERICDLIEETAIPINMINLLGALPGTKLWTRLKKEGRLRSLPSGTLVRSCRLDCLEMNFDPSRPIEEIRQEYLNIWGRIYEPSRFLARTHRYYLAMRPTRAAAARKQGRNLTAPAPSYKLSLRERFYRVWGFLFLVWRQGIARSCRLQFWRQLFEMWRHNPSRMVTYLIACFVGEDMMRLRDQICGNEQPFPAPH